MKTIRAHLIEILIVVGVIIMLAGCHKTLPPKFKAGEMVKVINDEFYAGCYGTVYRVYHWDGDNEYELKNVTCGVLTYEYISSIKEENLAPDTLTFIVPVPPKCDKCK